MSNAIWGAPAPTPQAFAIRRPLLASAAGAAPAWNLLRSTLECFNCGEKGHYSNKCTHPPKEGGRGGGSGGRGGGKPRGGGKGKRDVSKADAKA